MFLIDSSIIYFIAIILVFTVFTAQTVVYGWDIIQLKFCGVVCKHSFCKCSCNVWWWLFIKAEICCSMHVCYGTAKCSCDWLRLFVYVLLVYHKEMSHVKMYTFYCRAVSNWILWDVLPDFAQNMQFVLMSEIYFCVYCSESFASLQEDENKRLIWKSTREFQNLCVYVFNIWIIALNAELHLCSHIKYHALWS